MNRRESALDLAQRILDSVDNKLTRFKKLNQEQLCRFSGMGIAKSSAIVAALELARRIHHLSIPEPKLVYLFDWYKKQPGVISLES